MAKKNQIVIYMPCGPDANECWSIVRDALEDVGITDIRPAPPQSLSFKPKHAWPVLLSSAEV